MKEVKITIPKNCELIKEGDSYIVKQKQLKPRSWEEFCKNFPIGDSEYYITTYSNIEQYTPGSSRNINDEKNLCTSKEEAEAFLALMQLRQLRKAWVGNWKQKKDKQCGAISRNITNNKVVACYEPFWCSKILSFPTKEMTIEFFNCFKDILEKAKIFL